MGSVLLVVGAIGAVEVLGAGAALGDETVILSFCPSEQCWLKVQM